MADSSGGRTAPDVAIVGGGIVGCALAYDLARQGASVSLFESGKLATEASWASAGIISAPSPRLGPNIETAMIAYRRYPDLIHEIEELSGVSTGWNLTGEVLPGNSDSAAEFDAIHTWQREQGIESELLDARQVREREPGLHPSFDRGLYIPGVASVLLDRVSVALARSAATHGARINEHSPVLGVEVQGGSAAGIRTIHGSQPAGSIVIAAGAWSSVLGESIDFDIPTNPARGQMIAVADPPVPVHSVLAYGGAYIVPRADGTIAVGSTEEPEAGFDKSVTPAGIRLLADRMESVVPSLIHGRIHATWAGLRPGSRDGAPIIGRVPHLSNVWVATGHFRSGALLAPGTSEILASSILSGQVDERLQPFDPARFA